MRKDVFGQYAGVRPLLKTEGVKEGAVSREYTLKEHKRGDNVILSVVGGKLTTYRSLAEKSHEPRGEDSGRERATFGCRI